MLYALAPGAEEDLDDAAFMKTQGLTCHPTSIINFDSECCSVTVLSSDSQPVRVLRFTAEDAAEEDHQMPAGPAKASGVTEVVAMAEVSAAESA